MMLKIMMMRKRSRWRTTSLMYYDKDYCVDEVMMMMRRKEEEDKDDNRDRGG